MKKPSTTAHNEIQFIGFWQGVAAELGNSRLRISLKPNNIHELVDKDCDGPNYLKKIIKKSYKLSRCQHIKSPISLEKLLNLLGETAFELQGKHRDDLFDIELLEEIAWHISSRYSAQIKPFISNIDELPTDNSAAVISFPNYKTRKANSNL